MIAAQPRRPCSRAWRSSTTPSSGSPATPTTTSPTRPTTCCRRSRRSSAAAASARSFGSRSRATMSARLREQLTTALRSTSARCTRSAACSTCRDLWDVAGISGFDELRDPPFTPGHPAAAARRGGAGDRPVRGDPRGRHPRPPPLRLVRDLGRAVRQAGRRTTPTSSRSSRPSTGRAPTRRSSRR